ncbi:MAG: DUF4838 domain-containing protein [Armatimonadetes bacterium]|nr:DUF4838 domain-containing protein [Armatimonadota bacterium]
MGSNLASRCAGWCWLAPLLALPSAAGALTLSQNGRTTCRIVVAADATAPEKLAARELADYVQQITGATFAVGDESTVPAGAPQILVGPSGRAKALAPDVAWDSLASDSIVLRTAGERLVLAGARPRGTLYAVYTFLEDGLGVRWWTASESYVPRRPTLFVPTLNRTYTPPLRYREAFYHQVTGRNPEFAARLKLNGHFQSIPPERGGHYEILGWCHTFSQLLPPEKHFAQHPGWYSLIGDKRVADGAQLCLTNPEVKEALVTAALEWIRKNPAAGMISIAQNDCGGNCQCDKCRAVEAEEGAPSGLLIRFVNQVAEEIEKQYPEFLVETLAYTYTRKAPLHAVPRHNVIVRLCSIECDFAHPLDSDRNKPFRDDLLAWARIAPNLYIWNYVTDFANFLLPHPNLRGLGPDLRFFVANHVVSVFEQGDAYNPIGDFVRLRLWVIAHLLWDPNLDENSLIKEFVTGYYGAAAPEVQAWLDLQHDDVAGTGVRLGCFHGNTALFDLPVVNRATELWDRAAAAVKDDAVLSERVQRDRLPVDLLWLLNANRWQAQAKRRGEPYLGPTDLPAACATYLATARAHHAGPIGEGGVFDSYVPQIEAKCRPRSAAKPPEECRGLKDEQWLDFQDFGFTLYGAGSWSMLVDDPAASDGRAARMPGSHVQWAVQQPLDGEAAGRFHVFLRIRVAAKAKEGVAFSMGVYDADHARHTRLPDLRPGRARTDRRVLPVGLPAGER